MDSKTCCYLALVETHDHASRLRNTRTFLIAEGDDARARAVAQERTGMRAELKGIRQGDGGYFFDIGEKGCTAYLLDLREISVDAMRQLVHVLPCFGDAVLMPDSSDSRPRVVQL